MGDDGDGDDSDGEDGKEEPGEVGEHEVVAAVDDQEHYSDTTASPGSDAVGSIGGEAAAADNENESEHEPVLAGSDSGGSIEESR